MPRIPAAGNDYPRTWPHLAASHPERSENVICGNFADSAYRDSVPGPYWSWDRFGRTSTTLPDGRIVHIAGEHEDYYDNDFCIYNDVVVEHQMVDSNFISTRRMSFPRPTFTLRRFSARIFSSSDRSDTGIYAASAKPRFYASTRAPSASSLL